MADLLDIPDTPDLKKPPTSTHSNKEVILNRECIEARVTEAWPDSRYARYYVAAVVEARIQTPVVLYLYGDYWVYGDWIHPDTREVLRFRSKVTSKAIASAIAGDLRVHPVQDNRTTAVSVNSSLYVHIN